MSTTQSEVLGLNGVVSRRSSIQGLERVVSYYVRPPFEVFYLIYQLIDKGEYLWQAILPLFLRSTEHG